MGLLVFWYAGITCLWTAAMLETDSSEKQHANSSTGLTTAIRDFKYLLSSLLALSFPEPYQALKKRDYFKSLEFMKTHWNQYI